MHGFEADWRDAYPGINAVTLLDIQGGERSCAQMAELLDGRRRQDRVQAWLPALIDELLGAQS